ncbi:hypothetical protein H4217_005474 [Coemansia sp. RSA 1939]|nr:hypothetical protein H4217_005474 [Coemansia sp. RSA 1939]KAJ2608042.1 hypothetical protein EV177_005189 [Coemansia sp. RSA 1804]
MSSVTQLPAVCLPASAGCLPLACGSGLKRKLASQSSARCTPLPPASSRRRESSAMARKQRHSPLLRLASAKPSTCQPSASQTDESSPSPSPSKKRKRSPLQSIHIRALEHGLRVPISNTPLGTVDAAENIIREPEALSRPSTSLPLSPKHLSRPTTPTIGSSKASGIRSAPQSPSRPPRLSRRNSIACVRPALVFNL